MRFNLSAGHADYHTVWLGKAFCHNGICADFAARRNLYVAYCNTADAHVDTVAENGCSAFRRLFAYAVVAVENAVVSHRAVYDDTAVPDIGALTHNAVKPYFHSGSFAVNIEHTVIIIMPEFGDVPLNARMALAAKVTVILSQAEIV